VIRYEKYGRKRKLNSDKILESMEENTQKLWKIRKKILKRNVK
jgi:hypothetical protein